MFRRHYDRGKRRTREHVIADLSINFVERQILLEGHTTERWQHDYGIDLAITTFDEAGEPERGVIFSQVKATDHLKTIAGGQYIPVRIERSHLRHWLGEPLPTILIVYDSQSDVAYWLSIHEVFGGTNRFRAATGSETLTVRIPVAQKLDGAAVQLFRQMRETVMNEFDEWRGTI